VRARAHGQAVRPAHTEPSDRTRQVRRVDGRVREHVIQGRAVDLVDLRPQHRQHQLARRVDDVPRHAHLRAANEHHRHRPARVAGVPLRINAVPEEEGILGRADAMASVVRNVLGVGLRGVAVEQRRQNDQTEPTEADLVDFLSYRLLPTDERAEASAIPGESVQGVDPAGLLRRGRAEASSSWISSTGINVHGPTDRRRFSGRYG
jgi:hypothetical protein